MSGNLGGGDTAVLTAAALPTEPVGWVQVSRCIQGPHAGMWIDGAVTNHEAVAASFFVDLTTQHGPETRVIRDVAPGATVPLEAFGSTPAGTIVPCTVHDLTRAG